jgi:hypothetical protein
MANCDYGHDVSKIVASDREIGKLYLVFLRIIKQLADVVSSQNAGLDG